MAAGVTVSDVSAQFKAAFVEAAKEAIDDRKVLVCYGHPGKNLPDDIVSVGRVTSSQEVATMTTNRTRENTLTVDVLISVFRAGGPSMEQVAGDRAYALLDAIEETVRVGDGTTLGGIVRHCFLTSHESDGTTDPDLLAKGRVIEITATFTAKSRITS